MSTMRSGNGVAGTGHSHFVAMDNTRFSPKNLARCTETLLDALSHAKALAVQGELGQRYVDTLRFAGDILVVIQDEVTAAADPVAEAAVGYLAHEVDALRTAARGTVN